MKRFTSLFLTLILAITFTCNVSLSYAEEAEEFILEEPEDVITEINLTNVGDYHTMTKNEILTLTCDVESEDIVWTTSSRKIAIVDQEGNVKALRKGKAIITCYLASDPAVRDSVSIRVGTKVTSVAIKEKK